MFGFVFPHTVKFKVPGMVFFRRVHRVKELVSTTEGFVLKKFNGAWVAFDATGAVIVVGKKVTTKVLGDDDK